MKRASKALLGATIVWSICIALAQSTERVNSIAAPKTPLPPEARSAAVTKFSFIVYGDTRGRRDGAAIQYDHSMLVDSMLERIRNLQSTEYPIKFVLQSGDAVLDGRDVRQWNMSFVPIINRLTEDGGVSYYLVPGNHEHTDTAAGMKNYLDAVSALIPPEGSPLRAPGLTTYAFGYGNTFVIALDANVAGDEKQYRWIKNQLEVLDRQRYVNVIVFCHQAPFSSGPHGGARVEPATEQLRTLYMPLFNAQHVRVVFSGHEHLFEHWVERYTDASGPHRMDLIVSGGGGAPIYQYAGEPDLTAYLKANEPSKLKLEHLVKPGADRGLNPYHYIIVRVDGQMLHTEVVSVDWGKDFAPYRSNTVELQDHD
ncbi:MAG: metallophosphoesterase [Acidobacteria bacterium]|nr:metallophosphoesterase [Acidobacteriota bacterium]